MFMKGVTNVGFYMASNRLLSLDGAEAHLIRGQKFFSINYEALLYNFKQLKWITYADKFNPLLIEMGKWQDKPVQNLTTDNKWGCTLRCLQMLVANCI